MVSKTKVLNQEFSTAQAICPVRARAAMTNQLRDVIVVFCISYLLFGDSL